MRLPPLQLGASGAAASSQVSTELLPSWQRCEREVVSPVRIFKDAIPSSRFHSSILLHRISHQLPSSLHHQNFLMRYPHNVSSLGPAILLPSTYSRVLSQPYLARPESRPLRSIARRHPIPRPSDLSVTAHLIRPLVGPSILSGLLSRTLLSLRLFRPLGLSRLILQTLSTTLGASALLTRSSARHISTRGSGTAAIRCFIIGEDTHGFQRGTQPSRRLIPFFFLSPI